MSTKPDDDPKTCATLPAPAQTIPAPEERSAEPASAIPSESVSWRVGTYTRGASEEDRVALAAALRSDDPSVVPLPKTVKAQRVMVG